MERLESQSPKTVVPVRHVVPEDKSTLAIGNQKHRKRIERQACVKVVNKKRTGL